MKKSVIFLIALQGAAAMAQVVEPPAEAASAPMAQASDPVAVAAAPAAAASAPAASEAWQEMCLFGGTPPAGTKYKVVKKVREAKGTYGSAKELVPKLVAEARGAGGHAVIHYSGAQRFGFWPWRLARPVVSGEVVQWEEAPTQSCQELGGVTAGQLVASNVSPNR